MKRPVARQDDNNLNGLVIAEHHDDHARGALRHSAAALMVASDADQSCTMMFTRTRRAQPSLVDLVSQRQRCRNLALDDDVPT